MDHAELIKSLAYMDFPKVANCKMSAVPREMCA